MSMRKTRVQCYRYVGLKSPDMRYPLRYPGWGHYPPSKKVLDRFDAWAAAHPVEFLKLLYQIPTDVLYKESPFMCLVPKEEA